MSWDRWETDQPGRHPTTAHSDCHCHLLDKATLLPPHNPHQKPDPQKQHASFVAGSKAPPGVQLKIPLSRQDSQHKLAVCNNLVIVSLAVCSALAVCNNLAIVLLVVCNNLAIVSLAVITTIPVLQHYNFRAAKSKFVAEDRFAAADVHFEATTLLINRPIMQTCANVALGGRFSELYKFSFAVNNLLLVFAARNINSCKRADSHVTFAATLTVFEATIIAPKCTFQTWTVQISSRELCRIDRIL